MHAFRCLGACLSALLKQQHMSKPVYVTPTRISDRFLFFSSLCFSANMGLTFRKRESVFVFYASWPCCGCIGGFHRLLFDHNCLMCACTAHPLLPISPAPPLPSLPPPLLHFREEQVPQRSVTRILVRKLCLRSFFIFLFVVSGITSSKEAFHAPHYSTSRPNES